MKAAKITILLLLLLLIEVNGFSNTIHQGSFWYNVKFNGHKVGYYFVEQDTILEGNRQMPFKIERMFLVIRRMNNESRKRCQAKWMKEIIRA